MIAFTFKNFHQQTMTGEVKRKFRCKKCIKTSIDACTITYCIRRLMLIPMLIFNYDGDQVK